jgi:TonB family protein
MNNKSLVFHPIWLRRAALRLLQAAALGLVVALATPARAADGRAVKSRFPPTYPEIAKRMRVSGIVRLSVTVDTEGKVTDVKPLSGNTMLSQAAAEAVRRWRFEPGSESTEEIALNFNLP